MASSRLHLVTSIRVSMRFSLISCFVTCLEQPLELLNVHTRDFDMCLAFVQLAEAMDSDPNGINASAGSSH